MRNNQVVAEGKTALPFGLLSRAAQQFPEAPTAASSFAADQQSLKTVCTYLSTRLGMSVYQAARAQKAFLRYMILVRATGARLAPTEEADVFWHTFILHTKLYADWCQRHFGAFVHHEPSQPGEHPPAGAFKRQQRLGDLFFGKRSIYADKADCHNSHPVCHEGQCTTH